MGAWEVQNFPQRRPHLIFHNEDQITVTQIHKLTNVPRANMYRIIEPGSARMCVCMYCTHENSRTGRPQMEEELSIIWPSHSPSFLATATQCVMILPRLHSLSSPISLIWTWIFLKCFAFFPLFPICCSSHSFGLYRYLTIVSHFTLIPQHEVLGRFGSCCLGCGRSIRRCFVAQTRRGKNPYWISDCIQGTSD